MFRFKSLVFSVMMLSLLPLAAQSQTTNLGENVNLFDTTGGYRENFLSDTLFLGGPFLRDTTRPLVVWFTGSTASWTGYLYLMKPDGSKIQLMSNHPGQYGTSTQTRFDLTASVKNIIEHMDTVTFMYQTVFDGGGGSYIREPRYTGPNRSPLDKNPNGTNKWLETDRFWSSEYTNREPDIGNNNYEVGRRYSVAGWIQTNKPGGGRTRTDTAEFAFEDGGDMSFNDIRYKVTGLFLIKKETIDTLILNASPYDSILPAGDSIVYNVILKGRDSTGTVFNYPADSIKKYVTWSLTKNYPQSTNPTLTRGTSQTATNAFFATEAYQTFTVKITATKGDRTLTAERNIRVIPGKPHHIVIEGDTSGKPLGVVDTRPNVRDDQPLNSRTIASNQTTTNAFAVLRDLYGNYVKFSNPTLWTVYKNDNIVRATNGRVTLGEGIFTKLGNVDTAYASAWHTDSAAPSSVARFRDSIRIIIDNIAYDSLRITNDANVILSRLDIKLTQDTMLTVEARRVDGLGWMQVQATWSLSTGLISSVAPPSGSASWNFTPSNLATGSISVTLGTLRTTIPVSVQPGGPDRIVLYSKPGDPKPMATADKYESPSVFMYSIEAGAKIDISAKMFDPYQTWLAEYDTVAANGQYITWEVRDLTGGIAGSNIGTLSATSGKTVSYAPTRAWDTVDVIATFQRSPWGPFKDTVRVKIIPGPVAGLYIEGDSTPNLNKAEPQNIIQMSKTSTTLNVYAILRDKYENFVQFANAASWFSDRASTVTAVMGAHPTVGEGLITKNPALITKDSAWVIATSGQYNDSVKVIVSNIDYTELRVVGSDASSDTIAVNSLTVYTDSTKTLYVKGRRSDNGLWENVTVNWELKPGMSATPAAPTQTHSWTFSPTLPDTSGSGWIRVYMPGVLLTTTPADSVKPVNFKLSPPSSVQFSILTPTDSLRAGDTIRALVSIRNADGLIPGTFRYTDATYRDAASNGVGKPNPIVNTGDAVGTMGSPLSETFTGGMDTVKFVLYNADTTHRLGVSLGSLTAFTDPFKLLAGDLWRLVIVDAMGKEIDSAVTLQYGSGSIVMFTIGYDEWDNKLPLPIPADWTFGGTLHQLTSRTTGTSRVYYDAAMVTESESGRIVAAASVKPQIKDSVWMNIKGRDIILEHAITKDTDGDGYLDAIELHFGKAFTWPLTFDVNNPASVSLVYRDTTLKISGVSGMGTNDSVFTLQLAVSKKDSVLQTGWTPKLTLTGLPGVEGYSGTGVKICEDGAAPVIWKVVKTLGNTRAQDKVEVYLSEKVWSSQNTPYTIKTAPGSLFSAYTYDNATGWTPIPLMFTEIDGLNAVNGESVLVFTMSNGADLKNTNFMNIKGSSTMSDQVATDNSPLDGNRYVRVEIRGQGDPTMLPVPNPTRPVPTRYEPGVMHAWHEKDAIGNGNGWVIKDNAGVAIRVTQITRPDKAINGSDVIKLFVKVYDIVGNLVQTAYEPDLIHAPGHQVDGSSSTFDVDLYWNGFNKNGMPVAPGTYRVVVYIDYESADFKDFRASKNVGIAR